MLIGGSLHATSTQNLFNYFGTSKAGGVLYIDGSIFSDKKSLFQGNSALQGGAIYCQTC